MLPSKPKRMFHPHIVGMNLIETLAINLYRCTLPSNPAPAVERLGKRIWNPEPGDLVCEISSQANSASDGKRVGKLLRVVEESYEADGETLWDRYTYIELPSGEEVRWNNCHFITIPTEEDYYGAPFVSDPSILSR